MKKLIIAIVMILSTGLAFAQEQSDSIIQSRKERQKAEDEKQFRQVKEMIEHRDFVLESDYLQDKYGFRIPVNSTINFVSVDSTEAIIQIGNDFRIGPNGVGGITARGTVTKWDLKEIDKSKSFMLRMSVATILGYYDLLLDINASGRADAILTGNRGGRLTFSGKLVPWDESTVYVGQSM